MSTSKVLETKKNHIKLGHSKTKVRVRANNDSKGITVSKGPTRASFNSGPSGKNYRYSTTTRRNFTVDASASKNSKKLTIGKRKGRTTYKGSVSKNNGKMSGNISFSRKFK